MDKEIKTWLNQRYPNLARLQYILFLCAERGALQSYLRPNLDDLDSFNQALLIFLYNLEIYRPSKEIEALKARLLYLEEQVLLAYKRSGNIKFHRQVLHSVREMYPKIIAISHKCGLGLELKTGKVDVGKNISKVMMR